jgi:hypothetical protein
MTIGKLAAISFEIRLRAQSIRNNAKYAAACTDFRLR